MRPAAQMGIVLGILSMPAVLMAGSPGTSGGSILNLPIGARSIGMGEAFTAMADDSSSLYWNPAGLALLNQSEASFMYNQLYKDLNYNTASVATPLENGGIGANLSYLSYGQIQGYDASGNPNGDVNAYSGVATVGGAWLGDIWSAGVNLKGIQESLADVKANGFAADLGGTVIYPEEVKGGTLRAAATVRNLGSGIKLLNQSDPFPLQWRLGVAALQMADRKLNMDIDYGKERNDDGAVYAGAEYWLIPFIAFRAGYSGSHSEGNGLRAGIGIKFRDFSFDYAYSNYGDLGLSHRYELTMRFGVIHPRLSPEERKILRRAKLAMAEGRYGEATELFDALIRLEPNYRPVRRYVKVAMSGYEQQENAMDHRFNFTNLKGAKVDNGVRAVDDSEAKDLENLLNLSDDSYARTTNQAQGGSQEVKQ